MPQGSAWRARIRARPAVPPPDLDLELLFSSLDEMRRLEPRWLFYSHFGLPPGCRPDQTEYRRSVEGWRDAALAAAREDPSVAHVTAVLRQLDEGRWVGGAPVGLPCRRAELDDLRLRTRCPGAPPILPDPRPPAG